MVEKRAVLGQPVQCAEFIPAQIQWWVSLPAGCIAQKINGLQTFLPDGGFGEMASLGFVLHRELFDQGLGAAAARAGATVWTNTRALRPAAGGVTVLRDNELEDVECAVIVGADGPRSTVGGWIGQRNRQLLAARQVEVVLPQPLDAAQVYFDPLYRGGYGWLFPKGSTANVGVAVDPGAGGSPRTALVHLVERLGGAIGPVVGTSGGLVPAGGTVSRFHSGNILLAGDAAGQTHPVTGAGIFSAVVAGTLAGRAAVRAVKERDLGCLYEYADEWSRMMGPVLAHALAKRRFLEADWSDDPVAFSGAVRRGWIAFPGYGLRDDLAYVDEGTKW